MNLMESLVDLRGLLGERVSVAMARREHHSHGESYHAPGLPDAVCFPHTTEEVSGVLKICARYQLPAIPFGAGTSVEGQVNAIRGGVTLDMRQMNKVLRVSAEDMDATVQAGVTRKQLNQALQNTGLAFFVDPGADATIGGMAATRASGTTAIRYGTMSANVLALTVVLADGRAIATGTRARKSSAGYDLTRLFVGSEGTLGVITEVTLRLHPLPEAISSAVCAFASVEGAVSTAIEAIQLGLPIARLEFLDDSQVDAVNRYSKTNLPLLPTLFFEFHGASEREVNDQAALLQSIAEEHGGLGFQWAHEAEDREKLWKARHDAYFATLALRAGASVWTTDVCVPISRLAECIVETKKDMEGAPFPTTTVGHVGDGNFHVLYAIDVRNHEEVAAADRLTERMVLRALVMGGTCTGEHGIGSGKMKYLRMEAGEALDAMRAIKRAFDPENRMNPGKILELD
jgi:D-lactate dehydrogenase (cytochrome)